MVPIKKQKKWPILLSVTQIFDIVFYSFPMHTVEYWLRHYATSHKVGGSRPDEGNFSGYLILPATLRPEVYSVTNRNEYEKEKNYVSGE
jgi:hypothetical protein